MRVEAYTQVQQAYKPARVGKAEGKALARKLDEVQISGFGKDITMAKQAVQAAADIRMDVVAPLKGKVADGSYDVSPADFAEKILEKIAGL